MGALRRHRTLIVWLAVVALLGNVATALFSPAFAQRSVSEWPADLLGRQVICSDHAARTSPSDDGTLPQPQGSHCWMCLAPSVLAIIMPPAATVVIAPMVIHEPFALQLHLSLADGLRRAGLGSRAPPLPA